MGREAEWVDFVEGISERPECEVVGQDRSKKIYAFRTYYEGALTPGKADHEAYVSYADKEIKKRSGQLLRKGNYEWIFGSYGSVPPNAVVMGHAANGNPFYYGRAFLQGTLTPGKIYPQHECLYMAYNGSEHWTKVYTVLCFKDVYCPITVCPKPQIPLCPKPPVPSCPKPPAQKSCDDNLD